MSKIFISYRREDSADVTGRIGDRLRGEFGQDNVFTDVDDIPLGVDFRDHLDAAVGQCDVLLAVIGDRWLSAQNDDGQRRLDDPKDFVRLEIESALMRGIPVVPLLVRGMRMPAEDQLPDSLKPLAYRNAQNVRSDPDFNNDVYRLTQGLINHLESATPESDSANSENDLTEPSEESVADTPTPESKTTPRWWDINKKIWGAVSAVALGVTVIAQWISSPADPSNDASLASNSPPDLEDALPVTEQPEEVESVAPVPDDFIAPDMVRIPAGRFFMGSENGDDDEQPRHRVTVPAFELQRHELTWGEWEACEKDGGCRGVRRPWERFNAIPDSERSRHPAVYVNIKSVNEYLAWINEKTDLVYRLPSEAEWEYAARAGSVANYTWGDDTGQNQANCDGCGSQWDNQSTAPVGSFDANDYGLHDMHGNVWEWTADCWHENYNGAPTDGSAWLDNCSDDNRRSLRGGSWNNRPEVLRSAIRLRSNTDNAYSGVGFRLARTLP